MNKKRKKLEFRYIAFIALISVIIVVAILSYSLKTNKKLNTFESIIKDTTTEIQKVIYYPFINFGEMIKDYHDLKNVQKENKILKRNIEKYEQIKTENTELKKELEDMK